MVRGGRGGKGELSGVLREREGGKGELSGAGRTCILV